MEAAAESERAHRARPAALGARDQEALETAWALREHIKENLAPGDFYVLARTVPWAFGRELRMLAGAQKETPLALVVGDPMLLLHAADDRTCPRTARVVANMPQNMSIGAKGFSLSRVRDTETLAAALTLPKVRGCVSCRSESGKGCTNPMCPKLKWRVPGTSNLCLPYDIAVEMALTFGGMAYRTALARLNRQPSWVDALAASYRTSAQGAAHTDWIIGACMKQCGDEATAQRDMNLALVARFLSQKDHKRLGLLRCRILTILAALPLAVREFCGGVPRAVHDMIVWVSRAPPSAMLPDGDEEEEGEEPVAATQVHAEEEPKSLCDVYPRMAVGFGIAVESCLCAAGVGAMLFESVDSPAATRLWLEYNANACGCAHCQEALAALRANQAEAVEAATRAYEKGGEKHPQGKYDVASILAISLARQHPTQDALLIGDPVVTTTALGDALAYMSSAARAAGAVGLVVPAAAAHAAAAAAVMPLPQAQAAAAAAQAAAFVQFELLENRFVNCVARNVRLLHKLHMLTECAYNIGMEDTAISALLKLRAIVDATRVARNWTVPLNVSTVTTSMHHVKDARALTQEERARLREVREISDMVAEELQ